MYLIYLSCGQGSLCAFSRKRAYLTNVASRCGTYDVPIAYQQSVAIMLPCELCRSLMCSIAALGTFKPITMTDSPDWPYLHAARDHLLNRLDILYVLVS